jgi:alpha-L-rhamnosidase
LLCVGVLAAPGRSADLRSAIDPQNLLCEHRLDPLGIGEPQPRLTWSLVASDPAARGLRQSAYQILVASSPEQLARHEGDLWDSGQVSSAETALVYRGTPLGSRTRCWWKVRVWDQSGAVSDWSAPAHWSIGLLSPFDWRAEWIGFDTKVPADAVSEEQRTRLGASHWVHVPIAAAKDAPLRAALRRSFVLPADRAVTKATLLLTPDMRCAVTVNGTAIAEMTRWDRAVPLTITPALVPGENVIGLDVSQDDGYPPAVLGEAELTFADGAIVRYPIDATWRCQLNPPEGWQRPGFAADAWPAVELLHEENGRPRSPWGTPQNALHTLLPTALLRTTFTVDKPIRHATVYATALGLYELQLNGTRVGRDYLTPGWTEYRRRLGYQTYDVTAQLVQGPNAFGAQLGDGWFAGLAGYTGKRAFYGGKPRFRAQLEIEYTDGSRQVLGTDSHWRAGEGGVRYADLYLGAAFDARREQPQWCTATFAADTWRPVTTGLPEASPHGFLLEAATIDPVRVIDELPAKSVSEPAPGRYTIDLGQNLVGWVRVRVHGKPGQRITVRHGEMLNPNGTIYTSNLRGASATDVYWLRGDGEEVLEPFGTFHGFRYVEITGLDAKPDAAAVTGVVVHTPMTRTGEFTCSDPLLNQLFHNIIWGQKGNYLEVPTDCPQRDERLGWTGDTQFFARTGLYNFDAHSFLERWLSTIITDSQGENGAFPSTAPAIGHVPQFVTAWGDAALLCTHALWHVNGDTRVVERHFDRLALYIEGLRSRAQNGIVNIGGYGDWLNLGGGAKREVMDTAYYAHLCGLMADLANAIGRKADAARYAEEQQAVRAAWQKAFLQPDGSILGSSQTGYALAFTMDLLPDELKAKAAEKFIAEIRAKDWHLATGFIGTPRLLPALHAAGRDDAAYRLLQTTTYPSWLFQVTLGATTMWERWDGWTPDRGFQTINMNSFNHYAFGSVGEYLYRDVLGIDTIGAGFRHIQIAPQPGGTLTSAAGHYDAITGRIASAWKLQDGRLTLTIDVPPNTRATVRVPTSDATQVREGNRPAAASPGVTTDHVEPTAAVFTIGSGHYEFSAPFVAPPPPQ